MRITYIAIKVPCVSTQTEEVCAGAARTPGRDTRHAQRNNQTQDHTRNNNNKETTTTLERNEDQRPSADKQPSETLE